MTTILVTYWSRDCNYTVDDPDGNSYLYKTVSQVADHITDWYPDATIQSDDRTERILADTYGLKTEGNQQH